MQVLPILGRIAKATDLVVINWGLHYSGAYNDQLRDLTKQACTLSNTSHTAHTRAASSGFACSLHQLSSYDNALPDRRQSAGHCQSPASSR